MYLIIFCDIYESEIKLQGYFNPLFQDKTLSFMKSEEELKLILKEVRCSCKYNQTRLNI